MFWRFFFFFFFLILENLVSYFLWLVSEHKRRHPFFPSCSYFLGDSFGRERGFGSVVAIIGFERVQCFSHEQLAIWGFFGACFFSLHDTTFGFMITIGDLSYMMLGNFHE